MHWFHLSKERYERAVTVAIIAIVPLYFILACILEPLRSLAATSANQTVLIQVTGTLSMNCDGTATLTSAPGSGTSGTGALGTANCYPNTNNSNGYTLSWQILNSSGTTAPSKCWGNCWGTGHLLGNFNTNGKPDTIRALETWPSQPRRFDNVTTTTASGSRWGARLRSCSTTPGGTSIDWGTDGPTETFMYVATGSSMNIAKRNTPTGGQSDVEAFLFKVVIPSNVFQPTGTYKAVVTITATDN